MHVHSSLPDGYREIYCIDLQKDKKLALLVNLLALFIGAVMAVLMHRSIPISTLFDFSQGLGAYLLRYAAMLLGLLAYIILHELVHGITMKLFGTKHVKYGFTGLYAFAGSADWYDRVSYIVIALAPIVFWGIVLALLGILVPVSWFWVVWLIQISNISGAAGDLYVTLKVLCLPKDILIQDNGTNMHIYSAQ